ncbi:MAG: hypothetical protein QM655_00500 [Nocardioidaceae bacterium]
MSDAVHLERGREREPEIQALIEAVGERSGLTEVLHHLDRVALPRRVPGKRVARAYSLDVRDNRTLRWWPQGITSSADHDESETYAGRRLLVTSAYAKPLGGVGHGSRLTFFDLDAEPVRYRHVLLVDPVFEGDRLRLLPVAIHAGGVTWRGPYLHVAGTARGLFTFHIDDIVRLSPGTGFGTGPDRQWGLPVEADYVLPRRFAYQARTREGEQPMRYSFVSLGRTPEGVELVCGEYDRTARTGRLLTFDLDPATGLPRGEDDVARPATSGLGGIPRMQGAVRAHGRFYVTQSQGRLRRGNLWQGTPGALTPVPAALPPGPEDICYWPSTDQLWSCTEHPLLRYVVAVDRGALAN